MIADYKLGNYKSGSYRNERSEGNEISNLKKLRYLDLSDSYMSNIDNLTSLKNLNQLLLFGCGLTKLPDNIGDLAHLKFIGLVGNNFDPTEINRIKRALPNCEVYYH